jgi:predicted XRE-type DNA-binding protein
MEMKETEIEIERSSGNVYADLGFQDAAEMLVKAQLVAKISEILAARKWTQQQASKVLGIPQPKLSKMLRGQFRGISEAKMMECLTKLGRDIQIVIRAEETKAAIGRVEVISA